MTPLDRLLLGEGDFDLPTRVTKIRESIDEYPVENVQDVLDYCETLICSADINTANLGYTVIAKFAKYNECTPMHRLNFYNRVMREDVAKHYHRHHSYLFSYLTDEGRNVEGFVGILPQIIPILYNESNYAEERNDPHALGITMPDPLQVLSNVIKFNAKFIFDTHITNLIELMFVESRQTMCLIYPKATGIVDSLIAYTYIPRTAVHTLSQLISFWVGQADMVSKFKRQKERQEENLERYWKTFSFLLSTHLRDLAMDSLLDSLEDDSEYLQQARGAAMLMRWSFTDAQTRRSVKLDVARLLEALAKRPGRNQIGNACLRLQLIRDLLKDKEIQEAFIAELDWTQLQQTISLNSTTTMLDHQQNEDLSSDSASTDDDLVAARRCYIQEIIDQLRTFPGISLMQLRTLRKIALSCALYLNHKQKERLIEAYQPSAFRISVGNWLPEIKELAQVFIHNDEIELRYRQQTLHVVNEALRRAQELGEPEAVFTCGTIIMDALATEKNHTLRGNLVYCLISFASEHLIDSDEGFKKLVDILMRSARMECDRTSPINGSQLDASQDLEDSPTSDENLPSMLPDAGLVILLVRSSMTHPQRARMLFHHILSLVVSRDHDRDPEGTVMLMRGLFRIRSDIEHHIFYVASPEGERLATLLNRNANEPKFSVRRQSIPFESEEQPPIWRYGEVQGLPEDLPTSISPVLRSNKSDTVEGVDGCYLDMTEWLQIVTNIIENGTHWEVYSYIIVHLAAQLSNQSLFTEVVPQIRRLASIICQKIQTQTVMKPPEASNLRQGDVALCLIDILTTIIGYHWHFPRTETESMVSTFIMGLTAWDITTVPCVHALTLCCYELPVSLSRDLVRIVEKMSTIVTKSDAAIHVLEFLAGLSRLEQLTNRFHGDEIKTVFGVCFSYIEYARGKRFDEAQVATTRSANPTRQGSIASGQRPTTEDIPQYVFAISYHVITFWFLTLRADDQKKYLPWMEQRLLSRDQAGAVEDEALVTLDHLWRTTEGRTTDATPSQLASSVESLSQTWISDYCILTITHQHEAGNDKAMVEVTERRCSGTDVRTISDSDPTSKPEDIYEQQGISTTMDGPFKSTSVPAVLAMTDAIRRALAIFDRTSAIDFFKCGIIYVGEAQTAEAEILGNVSGSPDYNLLVSGLGDRLILPNHHGNVAGLDTSEGAFDGRITHQYCDGVSTLNYHVTTLMPTNREQDPLCTRKKSHIGNDYVNIVFNNSGLVSGFDFHTFPSAFNYVYIVVTPEARQTFIQTRTRSKTDRWFEDSWFRVQVMTREDFPDISSAAVTKVVSGAALASYVRNLALNAEVFCRVWTNRGSGEYPSSWRSRLGQIRVLRERTAKMEREKAEKGE